MVNYQNGKIYKIINENNDIVYIGSTAEYYLSSRYAKHKYKAPNHKIILIENYPCNSKEELCKKEQQIIQQYDNLINMRKAYSSQEEKKKYYENNKTEISEYKKKWYEENKTEINEKHKKYREKNKEYKKKYLKKYREENKEKINCEFCNCELNKSSLKKHQKTLKCMKFQFIED